MPNMIAGLKYNPPHRKVETEEQLFIVFSDLKKYYETFKTNFKITTFDSEPVKNFDHFLRIAISERPEVILTGSGDIGGLVVKDASLQYDLSAINILTRFWDIYLGGSCHLCDYDASGPADAEMLPCCAVSAKRGDDKCLKHSARRTNSKGGPARRLDELIAEAATN